MEYLGDPHATALGEPPGDATWKEEAVGACRGAGAPWVRPHPGVASPRPPSTWWLHVGPGLLLCGFGAQVCKVSGPLKGRDGGLEGG